MQNKDEEIRKRDIELVARALKDANKFGDIVQYYEAPLGRYIRRLGCRENEDINDLLQNIFIKVYINLNDYDSSLKFSSWIYRVAHNETVSFFRKRNIRPSLITTEEGLNLLESIADTTDFLNTLNEKINADILSKALLKIEGKYRDVLVLHFFEEKDYGEISDILKIPIGTVGTFINRGKKRLRDAVFIKNT